MKAIYLAIFFTTVLLGGVTCRQQKLSEPLSEQTTYANI